MHLLVSYKISSDGKTFVTLVTFIWFLPSVYSHMLYQSSFLEKKKHLSHWLHWYGFSPVCILWCIIRFCHILNHLSLVVLVWFFWSMCSLVFRVKHFSHWLHWYGFILLCIIWCLLDIFSKQNICRTVCIHIAYPHYVFFGDVIEKYAVILYFTLEVSLDVGFKSDLIFCLIITIMTKEMVSYIIIIVIPYHPISAGEDILESKSKIYIFYWVAL